MSHERVRHHHPTEFAKTLGARGTNGQSVQVLLGRGRSIVRRALGARAPELLCLGAVRRPPQNRAARTPRALWRRAKALIPKEDRRVLLSPPRLVARFIRFALAHHAGRDHAISVDDLRARDPELVRLFTDFFCTLGARYFRVKIEGLAHVPAHGPALLVGNHNGGLLPTDGFIAASAIHDHFGVERAVYVLTHDFMFADPILRRYALKSGMLRAGNDSARHALDEGHLVLVYPGSDLETFRSFRERGKVVLAGRHGFVRLALRQRVPIIPVVSAGTQEQFIVLTRGDRLARLARAHRWARTDVFPVVLALPWGLTSGFVPYLPLPAQTTLTFGEPIAWPELGPADAERPDVVDRCYRQVELRMQALLDELMRGRRFLLGKRS
jgi:1-acyl-sn-glycerol-3-phosphate acyltransferase